MVRPGGMAAAGLGLCALLAAGGALASGGGGGGGGGSSSYEPPSASTPRYSAAQLYRMGLSALAEGKFKDADRAFKQVLESDPKDADTLYNMGLAKAGENDLKGAQRFYQKALEVEPQRVGAHRQLALVQAKLGQTDKAKAELDWLKAQAATCAGTCPQADELKAAVTEAEATVAPDPAKAAAPVPAAALDRPNLLFATPGEGDHAYLAAVRLINAHRYAEALTQLGAARAAFGPHPDVLTYLGYVNRKLGRLDVAEAYYRQALALAPDHVGATEYYGELKVVRGDMAGAKRLLAKLDTVCTYGCVEQDDLRRWITAGREP